MVSGLTASKSTCAVDSRAQGPNGRQIPLTNRAYLSSLASNSFSRTPLYPLTQGGSPVRENRPPGSVRGAARKGRPYRNPPGMQNIQSGGWLRRNLAFEAIARQRALLTVTNPESGSGPGSGPDSESVTGSGPGSVPEPEPDSDPEPSLDVARRFTECTRSHSLVPPSFRDAALVAASAPAPHAPSQPPKKS